MGAAHKIETYMSDDQNELDLAFEWRVAMGSQLANERKILGLNQAEMAERLGIARRTLSDVERGLNTNVDNYTRYAIESGVDFALVVARARLTVRAKTLNIDILE